MITIACIGGPLDGQRRDANLVEFGSSDGFYTRMDYLGMHFHVFGHMGPLAARREMRRLYAEYHALNSYASERAQQTVHAAAEEVARMARALGVVVTIEQRSLRPFGMAHYEHVVTTRTVQVPT